MVPHLRCFIKAERRKTPALDGKQDEQVTNGAKEGRKHTTHGTAGRCTLSRGLGPQGGEWDRQDPQDAIKKNELWDEQRERQNSQSETAAVEALQIAHLGLGLV